MIVEITFVPFLFFLTESLPPSLRASSLLEDPDHALFAGEGVSRGTVYGF